MVCDVKLMMIASFYTLDVVDHHYPWRELEGRRLLSSFYIKKNKTA